MFASNGARHNIRNARSTLQLIQCIFKGTTLRAAFPMAVKTASLRFQFIIHFFSPDVVRRPRPPSSSSSSLQYVLCCPQPCLWCLSSKKLYAQHFCINEHPENSDGLSAGEPYISYHYHLGRVFSRQILKYVCIYHYYLCGRRNLQNLRLSRCCRWASERHAIHTHTHNQHHISALSM